MKGAATGAMAVAVVVLAMLMLLGDSAAVVRAKPLLKATAGHMHTCAHFGNDTKCFGQGEFGAIGAGSKSNRGNGEGEMGSNLKKVKLLALVESMSCSGARHCCAVLTPTGVGDEMVAHRDVKCWGRNSRGQLGHGTTSDRGNDRQEMGNNLESTLLTADGNDEVSFVVVGYSHSCAVLDDRTVKCWGYNDYGQLGLERTRQIGDDIGEMGASLISTQLGSDFGRIRQMCVGRRHTCARSTNREVKCWGRNQFGQLGYGDTSMRGNGGNEMGNKLPKVKLGSGLSATKIACGGWITCTIVDTANASVKCWGQSKAGGLGQGNVKSVGDESGEMGDNLPSIDLGTGLVAIGITVGNRHVCALLSDPANDGNRSVKCWGDNTFGQLGYGDNEDRGDDAGEMGDALPAVDVLGSSLSRRITGVVAGSWHTCAMLDDVDMKCWGRNTYGQLGYGDSDTRGDNPGEMGDSLPIINLYDDEDRNGGNTFWTVGVIIGVTLACVVGCVVLTAFGAFVILGKGMDSVCCPRTGGANTTHFNVPVAATNPPATAPPLNTTAPPAAPGIAMMAQPSVTPDPNTTYIVVTQPPAGVDPSQTVYATSPVVQTAPAVVSATALPVKHA